MLRQTSTNTSTVVPERIVGTSSDPTTIILGSTVLVGLAVAVAHVVEGPIALAVVVGASLAFFVSPVVALVILARRGRLRQLLDPVVLAGLLAAAVGTMSLVALGIARLYWGMSALVWNIDLRYHLNHAQTIARTAGLGHALDYLGADARYHTGPAWIAGAFQHFFGAGIDEVTYLALPFMTGVVTLVAGASLCTALGSERRAAVVAAGMLLVLPIIHLDVSELADPTGFHDAMAFLARFVPTQQFAWSVGLASLAFLASRRPRAWIAGSAGLATIVVAKPQYFAGFLLAAVAIAIVLTLSEVGPARADSMRRFLICLGAAILGAFVILALSGSAEEVAPPALKPFDTGLDVAGFRNGIVLAALLVTGIAVAASRVARRSTLLQVTLVVGFLAAVLLAGLAIVQIPMPVDAVAAAKTLNLPLTSASRQNDFAQAIRPVMLLLTMFAVAGIGTIAIRSRSWGAGTVAVVAVIAALAPLPLFAYELRHPIRGYEATNDGGLKQVLEQAPAATSVLVASDLADPAGTYYRSLRAPLLTGYGGHQFVVSNLAYSHYREPDAFRRLTSLQRFFGSDVWTPWHTKFVKHFGVTHALVDDRCPPNWTTQPAELDVVARSGTWTLLAVRPDLLLDPAGSDDTKPPAWRPVEKQYGLAPCLNGYDPNHPRSP